MSREFLRIEASGATTGTYILGTIGEAMTQVQAAARADQLTVLGVEQHGRGRDSVIIRWPAAAAAGKDMSGARQTVQSERQKAPGREKQRRMATL